MASAYLCCSFVCDELDGRAARAFNQSSTFGAVLDMLTDRYNAWHLASAQSRIQNCILYSHDHRACCR